MSTEPTEPSLPLPKPLKMSPIPQMANETTMTPMTSAITVRPSQFFDAARMPSSI